MLLTINAPHIERRLQRAAQEQNTTPAELAKRLLEASLPVASGEAENGQTAEQPAEAGTWAERKELFHRMLEDNRTLGVTSLPSGAFERESFYEDERHL